MFKKLQRRGKVASKYKLSCTVLTLEQIPSTNDQARVLWTRGNKEWATSWVPVSRCTAVFNQQLESTVTIYTDPDTGKAEAKEFAIKIQGKAGSRETVIGKAKLDGARFTQVGRALEDERMVVQIPFVQGGITILGQLNILMGAEAIQNGESEAMSLASRSSSMTSGVTSADGQGFDSDSVTSSGAGVRESLSTRKNSLPGIKEYPHEGIHTPFQTGKRESGPDEDGQRISTRIYPDDAASSQAVTQLRQQVADLQDALERARGSGVKPRGGPDDQELKAALAALEAKHARAEAAHQQRIAELEDQLAALEEAAKNGEDRIAELEADSKEADERIAELEAELSTAAYSAMGSHGVMVEDSSAGTADDASVNSLVAELKGRVAELEAVISSQADDATAPSPRKQDEAQANGPSRTSRQALSTEPSPRSTSDSVEGFPGPDNRAGKTIESMQYELKLAEDRIAELEEELESQLLADATEQKDPSPSGPLLERIKALESELAASTSRVHNLEAQVSHLPNPGAGHMGQSGEEGENHARMTASLEEADGDHDMPRSADDGVDSAKEAAALKLDEELQGLIDERDSLKQQVAQLSHQVKSMEGHTQILAAGWEEKLARLREDLQERDEQIASLQSLSQGAESMQGDIAALQQTVIDLGEERDAMRHELQDVKGQLQEMEEQERAFADHLVADQRATTDLSRERALLAMQLSEAGAELDMLRPKQGQVKSLDASIQVLQARIEEQEEELRRKEDRNDATMEELAAVHSELTQLKVRLDSSRDNLDKYLAPTHPTQPLADHDALQTHAHPIHAAASHDPPDIRKSADVSPPISSEALHELKMLQVQVESLRHERDEAKLDLSDAESRVAALQQQQQMLGRKMVYQEGQSSKTQTLLEKELVALKEENQSLSAQVSFTLTQTHTLGQNLSLAETLPLDREESSVTQLALCTQARQKADLANALLVNELHQLQAQREDISKALQETQHELMCVKEAHAALALEHDTAKKRLSNVEENIVVNAALARDTSKNFEESASMLQSERDGARAEHQKTLRQLEALQDVYDSLSAKFENSMLQLDLTKQAAAKAAAESAAEMKIMSQRVTMAEVMVAQRDNLQALFVKQAKEGSRRNTVDDGAVANLKAALQSSEALRLDLEKQLQAAERALDAVRTEQNSQAESSGMAVTSSMRPFGDHLGRGWPDDARADFSGHEHLENGHDDYEDELERELSSLRQQLQQSKDDNARLKSRLADIDSATSTAAGEQEAFQKELAMLRLPRDADASSEQVAELRRLLDQALADKEQLERANQALMNQDIEEEVNRRITELLEVKEAEFEKLVNAWQDAEQHLVNEADLAHQEVLEMRKTNYRLEMSLRDSEAKRELMQAQKNLVEQQLQETAGDLVQAERELSRSGVRSPGSETSRSLRKLGTSISMVDDLEKELSKYKAEFDSVMSELVEKKLELAELSDKHTRLQHDFTRLRDDKNGVLEWKKNGRK